MNAFDPYVIDDTYSETTPDSQCMTCKHLETMGHCTAYPDGIPMSIWSAKENHDKPRVDDHGIQFEPSPQ